MNLRELITEYILFAYDEQQLLEKFHVAASELSSLADVDLLEIYDTTLLFETPQGEYNA
jgi:hypothetical protein